MEALATFLVASSLTVVQLLPRGLRQMPDARRRRLHSAAGGVSVAFIFLHLLPEVHARDDAVTERLAAVGGYVDQVTLSLALVGLVGFYGIEVLARSSSRSPAPSGWADHVGIGVFAIYYAVIGYLLWGQIEDGMGTLVAYGVAMGLHLLVVDYGLREHHRQAYEHEGRWLLAAAVVVGWSAGWVGEAPEWVLGSLLSVFAGALALVSLKEELPPERAGHYLLFLTGAAAYAALLSGI